MPSSLQKRISLSHKESVHRSTIIRFPSPHGRGYTTAKQIKKGINMYNLKKTVTNNVMRNIKLAAKSTSGIEGTKKIFEALAILECAKEMGMPAEEGVPLVCKVIDTALLVIEKDLH